MSGILLSPITPIPGSYVMQLYHVRSSVRKEYFVNRAVMLISDYTKSNSNFLEARQNEYSSASTNFLLVLHTYGVLDRKCRLLASGWYSQESPQILSTHEYIYSSQLFARHRIRGLRDTVSGGVMWGLKDVDRQFDFNSFLVNSMVVGFAGEGFLVACCIWELGQT
jgi:hypothetical protein